VKVQKVDVLIGILRRKRHHHVGEEPHAMFVAGLDQQG
jgi:hypothetical protein